MCVYMEGIRARVVRGGMVAHSLLSPSWQCGGGNSAYCGEWEEGYDGNSRRIIIVTFCRHTRFKPLNAIVDATSLKKKKT